MCFIASVTLARVDHEPEDRAVDTDDDDDGRRIVQKKGRHQCIHFWV